MRAAQHARRPGFRASIVPFALAALTACATEPRRRALTGQFGGRMLGLVATDTAAHFRFACGGGVTGPLLLEDGAYRASGTSSTFISEPRSIDVTAAPANDTLLYVLIVVTTRIQDRTYRGAGSYELVRGVTPDFSGVTCLMI